MAESTSTRNKTGSPQQASAGGLQLSVRYWKRMKPNKVYPVIVSRLGRGETAPVTLRLVIAGAQVVPAERTVESGTAGEKTTFYVTPLAKGTLREPHLEVLQAGKKIQEIHLPCQACSQRPTLVWLFLAVFIPWLILHYFVYAPVGYYAPLKGDGHEDYVSPLDKKLKPLQDYKTKLKIIENRNPAKDGAPPTERITDFVQDNMPKFDRLLGKDSSVVDFYKTKLQGFPERAYIQLFSTHYEYYEEGHPPAFYIFLLFVLIALVSFALRQERRATAIGRPLPAANADD